MKTLFALLNRYARVLIYFAWFWGLGGVLSERRYEQFLWPEFRFLLAAGLVLVLVFGLVELGRLGRAPRAGLTGALRWCVLLAPLLYLPATQGVTLGASEFDKRWTGMRAYDRVPAGLEPSAEAATSQVTLVDLCWDPERYHGREVAVEGLLKHTAEVTSEFGADACLLYRFMVNCCVADAVPVVILLAGRLPADMPDDIWVRAEGVFRLEERAGETILRLDLRMVTPASRPRNPYLY